MRVAYRESLSKIATGELELDKVIGGHNLYAKLKIQVESTLDDFDF